MENKKVNLDSFKNLDGKDDYHLGLDILREMAEKGLKNSWNYEELKIFILEYAYGLSVCDDLHDFLKRNGANVLESF